MVGTNNNPSMSVSIADNFQNLMEEYGDTMIFIFVIGIIVGIMISYFFCCLKNVYKQFSKKNNNTTDDCKSEEQEKTTESSQEQNISKQNYIFLIVCIGFAIIMCIAAIIMAS